MILLSFETMIGRFMTKKHFENLIIEIQKSLIKFYWFKRKLSAWKMNFYSDFNIKISLFILIRDFFLFLLKEIIRDWGPLSLYDKIFSFSNNGVLNLCLIFLTDSKGFRKPFNCFSSSYFFIIGVPKHGLFLEFVFSRNLWWSIFINWV